MAIDRTRIEPTLSEEEHADALNASRLLDQWPDVLSSTKTSNVHHDQLKNEGALCPPSVVGSNVDAETSEIKQAKLSTATDDLASPLLGSGAFFGKVEFPDSNATMTPLGSPIDDLIGYERLAQHYQHIEDAVKKIYGNGGNAGLLRLQLAVDATNVMATTAAAYEQQDNPEASDYSFKRLKGEVRGGDYHLTVEYAHKVPVSSGVEGLLGQLPGVQFYEDQPVSVDMVIPLKHA